MNKSFHQIQSIINFLTIYNYKSQVIRGVEFVFYSRYFLCSYPYAQYWPHCRWRPSIIYWLGIMATLYILNFSSKSQLCHCLDVGSLAYYLTFLSVFLSKQIIYVYMLCINHHLKYYWLGVKIFFFFFSFRKAI